MLQLPPRTFFFPVPPSACSVPAVYSLVDQMIKSVNLQSLLDVFSPEDLIGKGSFTRFPFLAFLSPAPLPIA